MNYIGFVEVYERLAGTTKRLEKVGIVAEFLKKIKSHGKAEWLYLLNGKVVPDYDAREFGISRQLVIKAIARSFGVSEGDVLKEFRKIGDLGEIAEEFAKGRKQKTLFSKKLSVDGVFGNLRKIMEIEGKGAVEKKMSLVSEILGQASSNEAKYIIRTLLGDLRVGIAVPTIIDAMARAFAEGESKKIQEAYDMANDFAVVFEAVSKSLKELDKIGIVPGRAMGVMLAVKAESMKEAFEICGKPAAIEHKYDGFRMLLNKKGKEIKLFTRRLEDVTKQFPDVVKAVREGVKGESFVLDAEVVGYDPKTKKYKPFEAISQRIKRKYDVDRLVKTLPVEIDVFDVLYHNGKGHMNEKFSDRRKLVEKIVKSKVFVIRPAMQIVTGDEKKALRFYEDALNIGEEGIIVKNLDAPYKQGRKVGYMAKLKPVVNDFDLVIVGAEYGTGKRGGMLTSYILACRDRGKLLEVGKVASGLKEKEEEGTTYGEMTKLLKPLIVEEEGDRVRVKPKIVISVTYQNIQESPTYDSGYALRFPRVTGYRPDRRIDDIATISDIKKAAKKN